MSYGTDRRQMSRRAAEYVDKILKGAKPGDLPVEQPTQYRVTVRGEQKWFAQCGFEATSVTWLFPGMSVRVEAPCLDCGERMVVEMRDGSLVTVDPPPGIVGHLNYGFGPSRGRPPFL